MNVADAGLLDLAQAESEGARDAHSARARAAEALGHGLEFLLRGELDRTYPLRSRRAPLADRRADGVGVGDRRP